MRTIQSGSLEEYLRSIWDALSLGLTLEKSKSIQEMLRPNSKMRFCVRLEGHDFFIEIGAGQPAKLHRSLPDDLEEIYTSQSCTQNAATYLLIIVRGSTAKFLRPVCKRARFISFSGEDTSERFIGLRHPLGSSF